VSQPIQIAAPAVLSQQDIRPVIDLLELQENILQAIGNLCDSELSATERLRVQVHADDGYVASVYWVSPALAQVALVAMRDAVANELRAKQIEVAA